MADVSSATKIVVRPSTSQRPPHFCPSSFVLGTTPPWNTSMLWFIKALGSTVIDHQNCLTPTSFEDRSELPQYQIIEDEYGEELPFQIVSHQYYQVNFQRIHGDPHTLHCNNGGGGSTCLDSSTPISCTIQSNNNPNFPGNMECSKPGDFPIAHAVFPVHSATTVFSSSPSQPYKTEVITTTGDDERLSEVFLYHDDIEVIFNNNEVRVVPSFGLTITYKYDDNIYHQLDSGAILRTTGIKGNVEFAYLSSQMTVIRRGGIFNMTGGKEHAMSINVIGNDIDQMDGLVGQVHGYHLYRTAAEPSAVEQVAMVKVVRGEETLAPMIATKRICHLTRAGSLNAECINVDGNIFDNLQDYLLEG